MPNDDLSIVSSKPSGQRVLPRVNMGDAPGAGQGDQLSIISSKPSTDQAEDLGKGLVEKGKKLLTQKDKDIDYSTGADFGTRVMLQRADNPNEAAKALEKIYGKGNYGQDSKGAWWIKQDGKQIAVLPRGFSGAAKNLGSGAAASSAVMGGTILGGAIGEAVFPFGGGIPGAMVGASAGKAADDFVKWAQGVFSKKPSEMVSGLLHEGTIAGLFSAAAPTARAAFNAVKSGVQSLGDVTTATRTMAGHLSSGGAFPPVGSVAPGLTATEAKRKLSNILAGGSPKKAANLEYVDRRMRGILSQEGMPAPEINSFMTEVANKYAEPSASEAGSSVVGRAKEIHSQLINEHNGIMADVGNAIRGDERILRQQAQAPVSLGLQIADTIKARRIDFARKMGQAYEAIDQMTGSRLIVPTAPIRRAAIELADTMPEQAIPGFIKNYIKPPVHGAMGEKISFAQAHALRTFAREMGRPANLRASGIAPRNARAFAAAVQDAIDSAQGSMGRQAVEALKRTDTVYRQGIQVYENQTMNQIVRQMKSGIPPEPGTVTDLFMREGHVQQAQMIMRMLPEETKKQVVAADVGNMIRASSRLGADGHLKMDGATFLARLDQRHKLLSATYPPDYLKAVRVFARDLAALDGKIDVTQVRNPTQLMNKMEEAIGSLRAADEFVKVNPLGAFVNGTPEQIDRAVANIARPGNEATTEMAARALGLNSPEWKAVQKYAAKKLFFKAMQETQSLDKAIDPESAIAHLANYTGKQQRLLFPNGMADDIRQLAKEVKFLFPRHDNDLATSFAAQAIKLHMPFTILRYIHARFIGWLIDKPMVMRFLASEIRRDPVQGRKLFGIMAQWAADRALYGGPGGGQPTSPNVSPAPPPKDLERVQPGSPVPGQPKPAGLYEEE